MPWRENCTMDERLGFMAGLSGRRTADDGFVRGLRDEPQDGIQVALRYRAEGAVGLRALACSADVRRGLDPAIEAEDGEAARTTRLLEAAKLKAHLRARSLRTNMAGGEQHRGSAQVLWTGAGHRRRRRAKPVTQPFSGGARPNDVWCAASRVVPHPRREALRSADAERRTQPVPPVLRHRARRRARGVEPIFRRAFREYGLPLALRTDNGPPFASTGAGGLSRLAVGSLKLGIRLERIEPGKPQQERTARAHAPHPGAGDLVACGRDAGAAAGALRPLPRGLQRGAPARGARAGASRRALRPGSAPYPDRVPEPWYDADHAVRKVRPNGEIRWRGGYVYVGEAVAGEPVGIAETGNGNWIVRFCDLDLGVIDRKTGKLRRFAAPRPGRGRGRPEQTGKLSPMCRSMMLPMFPVQRQRPPRGWDCTQRLRSCAPLRASREYPTLNPSPEGRENAEPGATDLMTRPRV